MRFCTDATVRLVSPRIWLVVLFALAGLGVLAPGAGAAGPPAFGVEKFVAANCSAGAGPEECGSETITVIPHVLEYSVPKEPTLAEAKEKGYTQAAGHPSYGVTHFNVNTVGTYPNAAPTGVVTHVRTDVGPGVSTNPEAMEKCSMEEFNAIEVAPGFYKAPECKVGSEIGVNKVTVYLGEKAFPEGGDLPLEGKVYNLEQPTGLASDFGVALPLPEELTEKLFGKPTGQLYVHTQIEGGVEWAGDYHDYYTIKVSPLLPLISSRLVLYGNKGTTGQGGFITNPSNCAPPGTATTSTVTLESAEGKTVARQYTTPIGTEGCKGEPSFMRPPFEPTFTLSTETTQSDQPTGLTTELKLPHPAGHGENETDSSQLENAVITLPEGMTLNASAAHGLQACKPSQIHMHERVAATCPYGSKIGTVAFNVPDLPPESLKGDIYLGGSEAGTITETPYTIYLNAESSRYGVSVRLEGKVKANVTTGRVTAEFLDNPEQPVSEVLLHFKDGPLAPIANPLACGTATTTTSLVPYIGAGFTRTPETAFAVDNNGAGEHCPATVPFAPTQRTESQPATGGASSNFTFNVTRPSGQQYMTQIRTVLPNGLVGRIPAVTLCTEAQVAEAQAGTGGCPASSRIGTVRALAGAGSAPYQFEGSAYLTGPYGGAPYGLAIVVPAVAGPFNLGNVVTHATINVEPYTSRVVVAGSVPAIYKGIPLRLQSLTVEVNRQGFMLNPTSCGALLTESTLTGQTLLGSSTFTTAEAKSPLALEGCNALPFKPSFGAIAGAKTSRTNGANIEVNIGQPSGQANIQQVTTTLPPQLPVRLSTLAKACPAATFEAGPAPGGCNGEAKVGTVKATTPVLPGTLTGTAWLVSHGNEAYPNFDLILSGDGVTVILVGKTKILNSQITTSFNTLPDVPVSSFSLYLPSGPNSVLGANGRLCRTPMRMSTTLVGQNGSLLLIQPTIAMRNCPVEIVRHSTRGATATLNVQVPAAGSVSGGGTNLRFTKRNVGAGRTNVKVSLTPIGREVLRRFRALRIRVRVGFVPKSRNGNITSKAFATVTFRA
jgi:hypothetical protein